MQRLLETGSPGRLGFLVGLSVFVMVALLNGLGRLQTAENALLGLRFEVRGPRQPGEQVVLLSLEEGSIFAGAGVAPWSRQGLAELVRRLDRAGAAVIGLDLPALAGNVIPPRSLADDEILANAMRAHGRVVLPMVIRERGSAETGSPEVAMPFALGEGDLLRPKGLRPGQLTVPSVALVAAAAGLGATNIYPDVDGAAREAPLAVSWGNAIYPSFALELMRVSEAGEPGSAAVLDGGVRVAGVTYRTDAELEVLINYVGGYRDFPRLPYR